jgi:hypothetical protein
MVRIGTSLSRSMVGSAPTASRQQGGYSPTPAARRASTFGDSVSSPGQAIGSVGGEGRERLVGHPSEDDDLRFVEFGVNPLVELWAAIAKVRRDVDS